MVNGEWWIVGILRLAGVIGRADFKGREMRLKKNDNDGDLGWEWRMMMMMMIMMVRLV